jgi:hypothetical protein
MKTATLAQDTTFATGTKTVTDRFGRRSEVPVFSLTGRLEMAKDALAVLTAASKLDGVEGVEIGTMSPQGGGTATLTWTLDDEDSVEVVKVQVNKFVGGILEILTQENNTLRCESGVDPHTFLESLKPSNVYDGVRNGPFSNWDQN